MTQNIYSKLIEAVEKATLTNDTEVYSDVTHTTILYPVKTICPDILIAELRKLEEEEKHPKKDTPNRP